MSQQVAMEIARKYIQAQMFLSSVVKHPRFQQLRNLLAFIALIKFGGSFVLLVREFGIRGILETLAVWLKKKVFAFATSLPGIKGYAQEQINKTLKELEANVLGPEEERAKYRKFVKLPEEGLKEDEIYGELELYKQMEKHPFEEGKTSGTVYNSDPKLTNLLVRAMEKFAWANPLHTSSFPGVRKMESEVVQMVVDLYNGTEVGACGVMTSGGTESILMAVRAYKEWAAAEKGITKPHIIIPVTAHAAFDKAADYFSIRVTHIPVNPVTRKVDINKVKQAICCNTILIVGSCPQYPHGIMDDIESLGKIAHSNNIGLHVDCCLGGFIVPFLEAAGVSGVRPFDFRVPGVTSISCDTHKYAFSPKGSSVIMYRTKDLRRYQFFSQVDWPGGVYASPAIAGSRPGALIVGCWTSLVYFGRSGYIKTTSEIVAKTKKMIQAVTQHPELFIFGEPLGSVFAFGSNVVNVYQLGGYLHERGWDPSYIQFPPGVHFSVTLITNTEAFAEDLVAAMNQLRANPSAPANAEAKFYGTASAVADRSIINRLARGYVDATYALM